MSKVLTLNFATEQRSLTAWNPVLGIALLFAGIIALVLVARDYRQQLDIHSTLMEQRDLAHLQQSKLQYSNAPLPAELKIQIEQANSVYALISTPWEKILSALETACKKNSSGIALLSIKADNSKNEIILTGEAKNFAAFSAFTAALSEAPEFQNITLTNDKLSTGNTPVVVNFDLRLNWRTHPTLP
jgi:hypothetical protein